MSGGALRVLFSACRFLVVCVVLMKILLRFNLPFTIQHKNPCRLKPAPRKTQGCIKLFYFDLGAHGELGKAQCHERRNSASPVFSLQVFGCMCCFNEDFIAIQFTFYNSTQKFLQAKASAPKISITIHQTIMF